MRTIRTKVYKFNELSEDAKQKAIQWYRNGNYDDSFAWDNVVEDAAQIGLIIHSLDDHRPNKGEFETSAFEVSCKIVQEHGQMCDTYKTAVQFGIEWADLVKKHSDGIDIYKVAEENEYDFDNEADELEKGFLQSILEDYRIMYNKDIEYQNSDEYIIDAITANEYEFTQDGKRF